MLRLLRRAYAIFKAYVLSDLVRSRGFVYGLASFSIWIVLFMSPLTLFTDVETNPQRIAAYGFTAILIFMFYGAATWDWAAELRWMINDGRLEYYIASGSGFLPHYLGILPVSLIWLSIVMLFNCAILSIMWGPPLLYVTDIFILTCGFVLLLINLLAYALVLGGTVISSGVSGFVVEILGFILPVATGGLTPLSTLPKPLQLFALLTPFSYPAEMIRYSILEWRPIVDLQQLMLRGAITSLTFLLISIAYFRYQLKKILREGVRATALW
ncbi:MAG: ABC transporter permease [Ignisphaera sp.]|nr:ABC transporter permease [Ignisphaera sp.]MCX8167541.1 ABC transporter permease [Ignisphaera sp.]MDW8086007.1 ABC transporter permease [Ignisphaera sp.]